jgi:flagellar hook-associated protein 1 FlgK
MSGLFGSLVTASRSLEAHRLGLETTGENIANINTPGYTRRLLNLNEVPPAGPNSAGRGVEVQSIYGARDQFIEARLRRESQGSARDAAMVEGLATVEAAIGMPGASLDARLTAFFDAFSGLANDVTSVPARDHLVRQGDALAQSFGTLAADFDAARRDADQSIRTAVDEVNELARQVAQFNAQIMIGSPQAETLRDQRGVALGRLAELAGTAVIEQSDGSMDVTLASGRALVIGGYSYDLGVVNVGPAGHASITLGDATVTGEITTGRIGGLLAVRDVVIPGYSASLDQLAYDLATEVNTRHAAGFDANGAAGGAFFTPPAAVAGAAASLTISAAIAADSRLIAGSATGAPGDNGTARALAGLRTERVLLGGTASAEEAWSQITYRVGADIASARTTAASHDQILLQLSRLRDQASGVSLDEEAANLMRYQRAYEANARYFTTIVDTLDTLMEMVR